MKLNFALFTLLSAVSAIPIIEKRANNPYLVCEASDYSCKQKQSTLCFEKANECWKTETDYSKCNELNSICNEIWSYTGSPQQNVITTTAKTTTTSVKVIPTTTTSVKVIPTTTTSVKVIPTTTTSVKVIPTTTTSVKVIPTTTTSVKVIPTTTTSVKVIPTTTTSVKVIPTTTTSVKVIPTTTTSTKTMPTSSASSNGIFKPTKDNVKIIGRANYDEEKGFLWFGLTDSGIEYKFTGKQTTIDLEVDGDPARFKIFTDGELYSVTLLSKKEEVDIVFDEASEHVVSLIKISECAQSTVRIYGIKSDSDKIEPTSANSKKIEFIGDSITCAYGVDGTDKDTFSTKNEDGTKSFAYKVAKKFNADYSMVSYSGFGIISGYTVDGERNTISALPQYYDKLGFSYWNQFGSDITQIKTVSWNSEDFIPDLIVINLGTNDNSYMQGIKSSEKKKSEVAAFVAEYQEFIGKIRSTYPDSEILCTLGIMGQELYPQVEEAVNNYKAETGDEKVNAFKFNVQNIAKNGKAVDWHPAHQSHVEAAYELIEEIETLYGWTADSSVNIEVESSSSSESTTTTVISSASTSSTKSPPPTTTTTKVPPTTYITSKVPYTSTTTSKNPPPVITTKSPLTNIPFTTTTSSVKVISTTTTSVKVIPTTTTTSVKVIPTTTTTSVKVIPTTTTSVKVIPTTTTTTVKVIPTTTTTSVKVIPTTTTTSVKVIPTTTTTKSIPTTTRSTKSVPTTTSTKSIPTTTRTKTITKTTTTVIAPTSSPEIDYYSCDSNDYDCKNKMAKLCYEELNDCWSQPYTESLASKCQEINSKCSKIY
ncbi:hypothetical protein BCR36DRAFT_317432 [Piromyces finnis]|uniref:Carbohydrate esterase 2 N-terminal domain-containing protein n=1 Tax=Piromyces finnis TaxID=1754191 RepID=A0A1Y1VLH9_9FUNG|nr:hypothetical protein BCR36DRAFT_317432 [Piromyces finnis]|eukprot:ORX59320.1 hypothetical protein BCR36DRAFT_317432 [Piromyces finnis]